ncbi:hypothetical protein HN51_019374, partial [Arachis hypogaea]
MAAASSSSAVTTALPSLCTSVSSSHSLSQLSLFFKPFSIAGAQLFTKSTPSINPITRLYLRHGFFSSLPWTMPAPKRNSLEAPYSLLCLVAR